MQQDVKAGVYAAYDRRDVLPKRSENEILSSYGLFGGAQGDAYDKGEQTKVAKPKDLSLNA